MGCSSPICLHSIMRENYVFLSVQDKGKQGFLNVSSLAYLEPSVCVPVLCIYSYILCFLFTFWFDIKYVWKIFFMYFWFKKYTIASCFLKISEWIRNISSAGFSFNQSLMLQKLLHTRHKQSFLSRLLGRCTLRRNWHSILATMYCNKHSDQYTDPEGLRHPSYRTPGNVRTKGIIHRV